jgi:Leucine-rich repeat (LRR) protein
MLKQIILLIILLKSETNQQQQNPFVNIFKNEILSKVTVKKPYIKECDIIVVKETFEADQFNLKCPLPFNSSSTITGCSCDFNSKTIDCFYSNKLNKFPTLVKLPPPPNQVNNFWSIDLKCKNFSIFTSFTELQALEKINILDLSVDSKTKCFIYDEVKKVNVTLEVNQNLNSLKIVGFSNANGSSENDDSIISLNIHFIDLKFNQIELVKLTKNGFSLNDQSKVRLKSIDLSSNLIRNFEIFTDVDVCYFKIENLTISNNYLDRFDVSFLILLRHLNASHNNISKLTIDFYEKIKTHSQYLGCLNKSIMLNVVNDTEFLYEAVLVDLDFSYNRLTVLPFFYLKHVNFARVEMLNFTNNRVHSLRNNEFNQMSNLQYIILSQNRIETIEALTLYGLNFIKKLDLTDNRLATFPDDLFNQPNLTTEWISFSKNKMNHVPRATLKHCSSTKYLYLNENKIKKLSNYSFGFMYNLLELYLSGNLLDEIEVNAFQIDDKSQIGPGLVEKLDLGNNRLTHLNNSIFSYLTNLRYLILNNNALMHIKDETFSGVNYLISLDLNINMLEDLSFLYKKRRFSKLRYLKLSHNRLSKLEAGQFAYLNSLKHLDLTSNRIKNVTNCAFYGLENSIDKLILNYNLIEQMNPCAFSLSFKNLRFVQILHNPIQCTNTCALFFTIYTPPYSIKYEGYECSDRVTSSNVTFCSTEEYKRIHMDCKSQMSGPASCWRINADKQGFKRNTLLDERESYTNITNDVTLK